MRYGWFEEQLVYSLQALADDHGFIPTRDWVSMFGEYEPATYAQFFGSYPAACELIVSPDSEVPSKAELRMELKRLDASVEWPVQSRDIVVRSPYMPRQFVDAFGSVEAALKDARVKEVGVGSTEREELMKQDLLRVTMQTEGAPTVVEYTELGQFSLYQILLEWGTWRQAISEAGVRQQVVDLDPSKDDIREDIKRVGEFLGDRPTAEQYFSHGLFSKEQVLDEFDWGDALVYAGYQRPNRGGPPISDELLEREYKRLAKQLGRVPTAPHMNEFGRYSATPYYRRYGSWKAVKENIDVDFLTE